MDGTPSSEGSDSTAKTPRAIATPTTPAAISSSSSTAAKTPSATSFSANSVKTPASLTPSQSISSPAAFDSVKQSNVSNGTLYKRSDLADRIRVFPSSSPSATASSAETRSISLRVVALPEVSFEETMEGTFVHLPTELQGKLGERSQRIMSVMIPEYERTIILGRHESGVLSRSPLHNGEFIVLKNAALQTINPRRFTKHGTAEVTDNVWDCPLEEDILHNFVVAFFAVAERLGIA
jgi:hypothetical protein